MLQLKTDLRQEIKLYSNNLFMKYLSYDNNFIYHTIIIINRIIEII
jgi:hypothetical protein